MAEIHYLGATQNQTHVPGVLRIDTPIDQLTEGELDLLLAKQRLEIEKANSAHVGGPFNFQQHRYDAAIDMVNHCIANIKNPDVISGIGENVAAIAAKKKTKTAAGKLLQKAAATIKTGVKAITKVATSPARLIAKGAMEIYLPKAAPFFLYLFIEEKDCPDLMKAKRKKALKFKNFIVSGLGMKEKHFMAIIRNKLTSLFKMSPESFIASKLKNRVSGIGATTKKQLRKANKGKLPKLKSVPVVVKHAKAPAKLMQRTAPSVDVNNPVLPKVKKKNPVSTKRSFPTFDGNLLSFAVEAIMFLIGKIGGNNNPGRITADDFPDIEQDAANTFEYKDLEENYDNLTDSEKNIVKDTATDLMRKNSGETVIEKVLEKAASFLNDDQRREIKNEILEGDEAIDADEAADLARRVKMNAIDQEGNDINKFENTGGGTGTGACSC